MRRLGHLLAPFLLACSPAAAQEATSGRVLDLVYRVEDLGGGVRDLEVKESGKEIRINLAADVLFDFDKADLRPEARDALGRVAAIIREHPTSKVRIEGHTDAKGSEAYDQRLSERRAKAVRDWLATTGGLGKTEFVVKGFGKSRPVAPNTKPDGSDDPAGRQKNRRVEIVVSKG